MVLAECILTELVHSESIKDPSRGGASVEPLPAPWDAWVWQHEAVEDLENQVQGCTKTAIANQLPDLSQSSAQGSSSITLLRDAKFCCEKGH